MKMHSYLREWDTGPQKHTAFIRGASLAPFLQLLYWLLNRDGAENGHSFIHIYALTGQQRAV